MNNTKTNNPTEETTSADYQKEVLCRFRPSELDAMKHDTGAEKDGSAVACFVRKNLRKRG